MKPGTDGAAQLLLEQFAGGGNGEGTLDRPFTIEAPGVATIGEVLSPLNLAQGQHINRVGQDGVGTVGGPVWIGGVELVIAQGKAGGVGAGNRQGAVGGGADGAFGQGEGVVEIGGGECVGAEDKEPEGAPPAGVFFWDGSIRVSLGGSPDK